MGRAVGGGGRAGGEKIKDQTVHRRGRLVTHTHTHTLTLVSQAQSLSQSVS